MVEQTISDQLNATHNAYFATNDAEDDDDQVRALAEALAPQVEELNALLSSPSNLFVKSEPSLDQGDDDDDMDNELSKLAASEQLLRQELEFAQDFSSFLADSVHKRESGEDDEGDSDLSNAVDPSNPKLSLEASIPYDAATKPESAALPATPAVVSHSLPPRTPLAPVTGIGSPSTLTSRASLSQPSTPAASRKALPSCTPIASPLQPSTPAAMNQSLSFSTIQQSPAEKGFYTLADHANYLGVTVEPRGGWYSYPLHLLDGEEQEDCCFVKEFVLPLPLSDLKRLFVGLADTSLPTNSTATISDPASKSLLDSEDILELLRPVRTVTIRIRPDVLCGAVMDAVNHALENLGAEVIKRQGGHLRGIVGSSVTGEGDCDSFGNAHLQQSTGQLPPFIVDAQLCVHKSQTDQTCERILMVRTYAVRDDNLDYLPPPTPELQQSDYSSLYRFREVSALIQRIESDGPNCKLLHSKMVGNSSPSPRKGWSPLKIFRSPSSASEAKERELLLDPKATALVVSSQLLQDFRPCVSVNSGGLTLPALSEEDWPVIESSWRFINECWYELDTRDLAYSSLRNTDFGAFPALPTIDVQFCSQMRRVCRESMIVALLRSASDLEQYARESEYSCANLIQILKPMFEMYDVEAPALPTPVPLTAYPLDFTPPQESCPPWGLKVMEAMNQIAAKTSDANLMSPPPSFLSGERTSQANYSSYDRSEEAVGLVLRAFQRQDDEEQAARIGRKNVQVMDRLAKMQAHTRSSIHTISDCYERSPRATKAANEIHARMLQATSSSSSSSSSSDSGNEDMSLVVVSEAKNHVPIHQCSILVGGTTTGTCYITKSHVLFWTQLIPLVGGWQSTLLDIRKVRFDVVDPGPSRLSPRLSPILLPVRISVKRNDTNEEVYTFRPSMGAQRWKIFVDMVQGVAIEDPDCALKFSDRGGLLYMYNDKHTSTPPAYQESPNSNNAGTNSSRDDDVSRTVDL